GRSASFGFTRLKPGANESRGTPRDTFAETGAKDRWDGCAVLPATWLKPGANEPGSAAGGCESQKLSRVSGEKRGSSRDTFAKTQSYLRARRGSTRAALRAGR